MPTIAPNSESAAELEPAGLGRRLGAMVYDTLLVLALLMVSLLPLVIAADNFIYGPAVRGLLFLEIYGFFAWFWIRRGQTIGMLAWRLRIRSDLGGPLTLTQATLRFLGALASFACLGLGYLWMLFDPGRRTWPDILSSSRVLHARKAV